MVSVRGFTATPTGKRSTGIVAATLICPVTARAAVPARDTAATAPALVAAGTIATVVAMTTMAERRGRCMLSCSLAGPASWRHSFSRHAVIPIEPDTLAGWFVAAGCCPPNQSALMAVSLELLSTRVRPVGPPSAERSLASGVLLPGHGVDDRRG